MGGVTNDASQPRRPAEKAGPRDLRRVLFASAGPHGPRRVPFASAGPRSPRRAPFALAALPLALSALLLGCQHEPAPGASPAAAASAEGGALGPLQRYALPAAERASFDATVVERIDAGSYGYLRVLRDGAAAPAWVVTMRPSVDVGARVRVTTFGHARDFDSRRLGRRFDDLYFAAVRRA